MDKIREALENCRHTLANFKQFYPDDTIGVGWINESLDEIDSALTAIPCCDGWMGIESAPTNTAIQVFIPNCEYYGSAVYSAMLVDMGTGRRWTTYGWSIGRDCGEGSHPTHWRPLPSPPKVET